MSNSSARKENPTFNIADQQAREMLKIVGITVESLEEGQYLSMISIIDDPLGVMHIKELLVNHGVANIEDYDLTDVSLLYELTKTLTEDTIEALMVAVKANDQDETLKQVTTLAELSVWIPESSENLRLLKGELTRSLFWFQMGADLATLIQSNQVLMAKTEAPTVESPVVKPDSAKGEEQ